MVKTVVLAAALSACTYGASFTDCAIRCAPDGAACPDGLTCGAEGLCRLPDETQTCATVGAAPSCNNLPATCGPAGDESCCATAAVPGGSFLRGYDAGSDSMYPDMSHPATISAFVLDRFEVTVSRFRTFMAVGGGTQTQPPAAGTGAHAKISSSGWDASWNGQLVADATALSAALQCNSQYQTWTTTPGANEDLPINCVTWYEAAAFCIWDGGYLPTEAEWNYAAAGGSEQRAYPWSAPASSLSIDCSYANYYNGAPCENPPNGAVNRVGSTSPKGDNKWGHADLAGNVWEWTLDWYQNPYSSSCDDCANLTPGTERVYRGADFNHTALYLRGAYRYLGTPDSRDFYLGIRCARPGS